MIDPPEASPDPAHESSPDAVPQTVDVISSLTAGYHRFRDKHWHPQRARWLQLSAGQAPRVMIIACSDSRVDPAQIFDVDPGEIFVVRNVAAMVPPFEQTEGNHGVSAALEFAVQVLKVEEIVVLGHGMCGGCKAALTRQMHGAEPGKGGFIANWIALLDEARDEVVARFGAEGREAERAMEHAGVRVSLANLRTFPCIRKNERQDDTGKPRLRLRGAFFAISDGVLHWLDERSGQFEPAN
ncbi:carbonic anhydrase [Croceicoccus sp. F390]|uniref:Carbonic anhydrase n=1 Tax=Croceicoccus esteveae TaxID=3075597 RepID=A0ABU2ZJ42_9SPHN|nr:carbonic anhydrase [Croceicoccus sp. F390]MDT0576627.1 carbonic anhydrase [Croceicoccus sp. F390]